MPILDDERFERYLKNFRPLSPTPLTPERNEPAIRRRLWANGWAVAAALALLAAALALYSRTKIRSTPTESRLGTEQQLINIRPLTIRDADALLFAAPSFTTALDGDTFRQKTTPLLKNEHSAIAVLSEENTKL